jgi:hypothetical protein
MTDRHGKNVTFRRAAVSRESGQLLLEKNKIFFHDKNRMDSIRALISLSMAHAFRANSITAFFNGSYLQYKWVTAPNQGGALR